MSRGDGKPLGIYGWLGNGRSGYRPVKGHVLCKENKASLVGGIYTNALC